MLRICIIHVFVSSIDINLLGFHSKLDSAVLVCSQF